MKITELYYRTLHLIIKPDEEFQTIAAECQSISKANLSFVIPLAILVSLSALLGSIVTLLHHPIDSFVFIIVNMFIVFLIVLIQTYLAGRLIGLLAGYFDPANKKVMVYSLIAYAQVPFYLALAFIKIFPTLIFFILFGIYSTYLLHVGMDYMIKVPKEKKLQFMLLSLVIMIALFVAISEFFTLLYSKIIEQFSTFAFL